jgi:hypothetical protein
MALGPKEAGLGDCQREHLGVIGNWCPDAGEFFTARCGRATHNSKCKRMMRKSGQYSDTEILCHLARWALKGVSRNQSDHMISWDTAVRRLK